MEPTSTAQGVFSGLLTVFGCFLAIAVPAMFVLCLVMALTRKSRSWLLATVGLAIAGLALGGAVTFFGVRGPGAVDEESARRVFRTEDGLATIAGPGDWTRVETGAKDATLQVGNPAAEEYLVVVSEVRKGFPEGYGLEDYARLATEPVIDGLADPKAGEWREIRVGGEAALRQRVSGAVQNTFLVAGGHFHQVLAWTLPGKEDEALPRLRRAADSFRLEAEASAGEGESS